MGDMNDEEVCRASCTMPKALLTSIDSTKVKKVVPSIIDVCGVVMN